jgi:hypothetical protein
MRRNLYLVLVAMLASAILAAGCGGGDDNGSSDSSKSSGSTSSSSDTTSSPSSNANVQQVVDSCKQSVSAAQGLSSSAKKDLNDLCEKAGSGDEAAARKASQNVCVTIVKDTIPSGPARDQAVDACKQTSQ